MKSVVLVVLFASCAHSVITPEAASVRLKKGAYLIDVRTPGEFAQGHLAGAVNVPVGELEGTLASLPVDRSREILIYGERSSKARVVLSRAGFAKIEEVRDTGGSARAGEVARPLPSR